MLRVGFPARLGYFVVDGFWLVISVLRLSVFYASGFWFSYTVVLLWVWVSGWCFLDGLLSVSVLGFGVGWLLIADSWFSCESVCVGW